jgi:leucyl/phenylalanyl-tRNA--protein transferase
MAEPDGEIEWYLPKRRALFPITGIRVSRSLRSVLNRGDFSVSFDTAFEEVMRGCLRPDGNWISSEIIRAFCECHRQGWGHSCEVWRKGALVGGVYGVQVGRVFSAESMFHRETDMSKVALHFLVERCREAGFEVFDAQIMNPHLASLGAYEVSDAEYQAMLRRALR